MKPEWISIITGAISMDRASSTVAPPRIARRPPKARLRNGRLVAVKVQRPGIRERMVEDLEALEEIAEFMDSHTELGQRYEFTEMLDQFRKSLLRELDYRQEASNLTTLRAQLREFPRLIVLSRTQLRQRRLQCENFMLRPRLRFDSI